MGNISLCLTYGERGSSSDSPLPLSEKWRELITAVGAVILEVRIIFMQFILFCQKYGYSRITIDRLD